MILSEKYELLDLISDGNVQTYRARLRALGQSVMVHFIKEGSAERVRLLDDFAGLSDKDKELFTDVGEDGPRYYLVSRVLPDFDNLPAWIVRRSVPSVVTAVPPKANLPQTAAPGEFTRIFKDMKQGATDPLPVQDRSEFSQWFDRSGEPLRDQREGREPRSPEASASRQQKPAITVRPSPPRAPASPSQTVTSGRSDSFSTGPGTDRIDDRLSIPEISPPSEFPNPRTQMSVVDSDLFRDPLPSAAPSDSLTDFSAPHSRATDPSYTQVIGPNQKGPSRVAATKTAPTPSPPAAPAVQKSQGSSEQWYWVALAVLGVLAVAIVLFFSLKS